MVVAGRTPVTAPSTKLCLVPLPRFAGEDPGDRSASMC
jgi:hypothetical protein